MMDVSIGNQLITAGVEQLTSRKADQKSSLPRLAPLFFFRDESHQIFHSSFLYWSLIPSGKRLHNYGKSLFLIGKATINGQFSITMLV
jgi:hypothetical protein